MKISNGVDKTVIGLDMDGVIVDFSLIKQKIAAEHGFSIALNETPSDIIKNIIPAPALERIKNSLFIDGPHRFSIPLMPGVKDALDEIAKKGVPIVLISRRKRPDVAEEVLRRHGLWPKYFNTDNTFFVREREAKDVVARMHNVTHYIDDEPSIIAVLHSVRNKILFDPFNVYKDADSYRRCLGWEDTRKFLQ